LRLPPNIVVVTARHKKFSVAFLSRLNTSSQLYMAGQIKKIICGSPAGYAMKQKVFNPRQLIQNPAKHLLYSIPVLNNGRNILSGARTEQ